MKKYILLFITMSVLFGAKAQLVNVCGTDTIILEVENYQNGVIEWQESIDNIFWAKIQIANGTSYKFYPTQAKYYRAMVKTSTCDPIYSDVTFVQLPPIANAGTDRVVGDTIMTLLANELEGAYGEWTVLIGNGTLIDPTNPRTQFYGNFGETFTLVWTVSNACGQSSDTVLVTFKEIQAKMNFIVVDNTDQIYSDSSEMSNGIYKIKFSDTAIAPYDSVILIGMREDISFLRKVYSFTTQDSIFTFSTVQATFADLILVGTINMGEAVNQSIINEKTLKENSFPTRQTIKEFEGNTGLKVLSVTNIYSSEHEPSSTTDGDGLTLNLPDVTIFKSPDNIYRASVKDSYVRLDPNFVFDYDYNFPFSVDIKFGADNAEFEYNYSIETKVTAPINFIDEGLTILKVSKIIVFMAGPIPVVVTANFEIKGSIQANVNAAVILETEINHNKNFTALVIGDALGELSFISNSTETSTEEEKFLVQGGAEIKAKIGPEISFRAYDIVGPYLSLNLKAEAKITMNTDFNWDAEAKLGVEGTLGAKAKIADFTVFDFNYELFNGYFMDKTEFPYNIELVSGNFQNGIPGETLLNPITIKVASTLGDGVFLIPVRLELESGNGTISETTILTNVNGEIYVDWTLGNNPENVLKVSVLNSDNDDIENSPLFVYANTEETPYSCTDSDLQINLQTNSGYIYPAVYGGTSPYTYSPDGVNYSTSTPQFDNSLPGNYIVFVKDQNGCIVSRSFNIDPFDPCAASDLELLVYTQANIIELIGLNGTSPYLYSIDDINSFSSNYIYNNVNSGVHVFYLKDNNDCIVSAIVDVEEATQAIIAVSPEDGTNYVSVESLFLEWIAGDYAPTQVYDIYLKKESEAYTLITENLINTSFSYGIDLDYNSNYLWKLVVKDDDTGGEIDFKVFSFTTASENPVPPATPLLLLPTDGTVELAAPVTLSWENQSGDFVYDLYFDDEGATSLYALNITNTIYNVNSLAPSTTYFWKIVIKSVLTGETEESELWSFSTNDNPYCPSTFVYESQVYEAVQIGTQCWMAENLNVGTRINLEDNQTNNSQIEKYCYFDDPAYCDVYGGLYQWNEMMQYTTTEGLDGICPEDWHIPTDDEWKLMEMALGMTQSEADGTGWRGTDQGGQMKSTSGWNNNGNGTNTSGFTALPGGHRLFDGWPYFYGYTGYWWSSSELNSNARYRRLNNEYDQVNRSDYGKMAGLSVRCIKNINSNIPTVTTNVTIDITETTATSGGNVSDDGGYPVIAKGVCWSTAPNPTIIETHTEDGTGTGLYFSYLTGLTTNTTYFARAYATNSEGTAYGSQEQFTTQGGGSSSTFTDPRDGQIYNTIEIGSQTWMAENLKYLPSIVGPGTGSNTIPYNYVYDYDGTNVTAAKATSNYNTYGVLYNWPAAMAGSESSTENPSGVQGVCPSDWHLPSDSEWTQLTTFLGGESVAGGKLKETGTTHWNSPNNGATNEVGFTALPGGNRFASGDFADIGGYGLWWSATELNTNSSCYRMIFYGGISVHRSFYNKSGGYSVRCIKNENSNTPTVTTNETLDITETTATCGGNISNDGGFPIIAKGVCWSTAPNPTISGTHTEDGTGTGFYYSYLTDLSANTTYYVRAYATNSEGTAYGNSFDFVTLSGNEDCPSSFVYEGLEYEAVQIGSQCWMAQNLNVGVLIDGGMDQTNNNQIEKYCYDDDPANCDDYGGLYQWNEMMQYTTTEGVQGICPEGWHIPKDDEWKTLEIALGMTQSEADDTGWRGTNEGSKLAGNELLWTDGNLDNNNDFGTSGFTSVPGGFRKYDGDFEYLTNDALFWTSRENGSNWVWYRNINYNNTRVGRSNAHNKAEGASVRCLKN